MYHHPDHHHPGHCPGGGNQLCERARTWPKWKLFALLRDRDGQGVQVSDGDDGDDGDDDGDDVHGANDGDEIADENYGVWLNLWEQDGHNVQASIYDNGDSVDP